ncbi:MAG: hypothetical protein AAF846_22165 [Chloroflexota bacterium]
MNRIILYRSMYLLFIPVFMFIAILACAGTALLETPLYICSTDVPLPTTTTLVGTPPPTGVPPATPYIIMPPSDFYVGDAVFIGGQLSPLRVRLRLQTVQITPQAGNEQVVQWQLEVANVGQEDYEIFPSVQLFVSEVNGVTDTWGSTQDAGDVVGIAVDSDLYQLGAGQTDVYQLAALTTVGSDIRFSFQLNPAQGTNSPVMTWVNQTNPYCSGDVAA